jgi:cardiolipin synthase
MSVQLLHAPPPSTCAAPPTFEAVLAGIAAARESITIHMYVWRSDEIGHRVGDALLTAAERGVRVRILKDLGAILFERLEMNRKSFFDTPLPFLKRLKHRLISLTFPDSFVEDEFTGALGERLLQHPGITLEWVNHTHTKYYLFDERVLVTGSINIEDRHFGYHDYMALVDTPDLVRRFRQRLAGEIPANPARRLEFLCNTHDPDGSSRFEIKPAILRLIDAARVSIYVEMAYLGDEEVTAALIRASRRGVALTFLFSRKANIGNDLNYRTIHEIFTKAPVTVHLTDTMIHSKLMFVDDETALLGSCNLSVFSLQKAGELDLLIRHPSPALTTLREVIPHRIATATQISSPTELRSYNPLLATLQQLHQKRE